MRAKPLSVLSNPLSSPLEGSGLVAPASASNGKADSAKPHSAVLLVQCPDQKGVVASLAQLLYGFGCNIVESDQFSDEQNNMFFQRIRFDYSDIIIGAGNTSILERAVSELARRYNMEWSMSYRNTTKRCAIFVSKMDHCLFDILVRHRSGELSCEIPVVVSNHKDLQSVAETFDVPFKHLAMGTEAGAKQQQEAQIEQLLQDHNIDVVVLARYMQIFSPEFCNKYWRRTINIHHSFLPAFEGAKPYHRAHERGVKIIGATAHYATSELDAGPIIEQSVARITHRDSVPDMIRKGRDLERLVLARALRWHLEDRVLVYGNKTVVFED